MFRFYLANLQQGALGIVCFFAKIICVLATTWFIFCFLLDGFHPVPLIIALACLVYVLWFSYYQSKRSYEWQVSMRQDAYQRGIDGGYGQMPRGPAIRTDPARLPARTATTATVLWRGTNPVYPAKRSWIPPIACQASVSPAWTAATAAATPAVVPANNRGYGQ